MDSEVELKDESGDDAHESAESREKGTSVASWLRLISEAREREKDWRKEGQTIQGIYEACQESKTPFNILYSNTDTLMPALYSNTPRPVVERRFRDEDKLGKAASKVAQRMLENFLDPGETGNVEFDSLLEAAVLDALLPGRGLTRFTYEAAVEEEGIVTGEQVVGRHQGWDNLVHGFAQTWDKVPWLAYEHFMTREELESNFPDKAAEIKLTVSAADGKEDKEGTTPEDSAPVQFAHVWEIWDKDERKVTFISPGYPTAPLKEVEDPLGLEGFFNCPEPMRFVAKNSSLVPTPLYKLYETQAKELNSVTTRINKIVAALKVRGFYDSTLNGLEKLLSSDDNTLLPAENVAAMLQGQTLEKAIWLFPIEKLVGVLQQLYLQRQQVKTVIYEITGISDILRGSTAASETATAQNIKNQWGTLRLKRMQKRVMRYVRSCLRIVLQLQSKHYSIETMQAMTGLTYQTNDQQAQARLALQQMQAQAQQAQAMQQPGQPPAPTPEPPPDLVAAAGSPTWEQIQETLSNDLLRSYKIDIETNSTVEVEATEDKTNMGEFLNALAQFMNGIAPMVQQGVLPFEAARAMLLTITRRYRFGPEVEDEIAKMAPPKPSEGGGEEAAKAEAAKAKAQLEMQILEGELEMSKAENAAKMEELQLKREYMQAKHAADMESLRLQVEKARAGVLSAGITAQ